MMKILKIKKFNIKQKYKIQIIIKSLVKKQFVELVNQKKILGLGYKVDTMNTNFSKEAK